MCHRWSYGQTRNDGNARISNGQIGEYFQTKKSVQKYRKPLLEKTQTGNDQDCFSDINKEFDSKVTYVSPVINNVNRTFKVEAQLPANMQGVLPNMLTIIKIADYTNPKAVVIPINLLQKKDNEGDLSWPLIRRRPYDSCQNPVTIGKFYHDQAEIKSGLSENQKSSPSVTRNWSKARNYLFKLINARPWKSSKNPIQRQSSFNLLKWKIHQRI